MKAAVFDPYLDTLGGGERYALTVAEYLLKKQYSVDIFWDDGTIGPKIKNRFAIDIDKADFVKNIFGRGKSLFERWRILRDYEIIFFLSDGSIPFLFAKKNILHFQVPFHNVGGKSLLNKLKLSKINSLISNSRFTKRFIDKEFAIESEVVYPPVSVEEFKSGRKENIILAVGRFSKTLHAKKQHILVQAFKKMCQQGIKNWQLVLVGGASDEDNEYVGLLKEVALNYPIKVLPNISFGKLQKYYSQAKVFWHAAGFGEDEETHPERTEHFGITAVEAMAAGCVPVVVGKGGLPEIIRNGESGFLWNEEKELINYTLKLIASESLRQKYAAEAFKKSKDFSKIVFFQKLDEIIFD